MKILQIRTHPSVVRLGISLLILAGALVAFWAFYPDSTQFQVTVIPPTCTDSGYSIYTNTKDGTTYVDDVVPATGHRFEKWNTLQEATLLQAGTQSRQCKVCSHTEEKTVYPNTGLPRLCLTGDLSGIGKVTEVAVDVDFAGQGQNFRCGGNLKYQGHSTLHHDKKNYTLKLLDPQEPGKKYKVTFENWQAEHKYILKANSIDPSQCRNLICADLWGQMVASRPNLQEELSGLSNFGAVDGFPIALYINGSLQGIYNMNLHKDDDLFGMEDGNHQGILIANQKDEAACFRQIASFADDTSWEVEFCGTADSAWLKDKLNKFIRFVQESDDQTFRQDLKQYLDVDAAVDYLLAIYILGLPENGTKDLIFVTYHPDMPWIPSLYDMENAFGLSPDGTSFRKSEDFLPVMSATKWDSATDSLLWDRVLTLFLPEIQARYAQLRGSFLTPEHVIEKVQVFYDSIPQQLYEADAQRNTYPMENIDHQTQITQYITARFAHLDTIFQISEGNLS